MDDGTAYDRVFGAIGSLQYRGYRVRDQYAGGRK